MTIGRDRTAGGSGHRPRAAVVGSAVVGSAVVGSAVVGSAVADPTAAYLNPSCYAGARRLLAGPGDASLSLGEFLRTRRYRRYFARHFVVPLVAAVWSCPPADALNYPARYLFQFLDHHGMLRLARSPGWQTVAGGSRRYVEQIAKRLATVATGVPIRAITRSPGDIAVHDHHLGTREFDAAVVATHPDQALRLLDRPTRAEQEVLGALRYTHSTAVLHIDAALLPRAPATRNYRMGDCFDNAEDVHVSYHLNRLQGLDHAREYLVTLHQRVLERGAP